MTEHEDDGTRRSGEQPSSEPRRSQRPERSGRWERPEQQRSEQQRPEQKRSFSAPGASPDRGERHPSRPGRDRRAGSDAPQRRGQGERRPERRDAHGHPRGEAGRNAGRGGNAGGERQTFRQARPRDADHEGRPAARDADNRIVNPRDLRRSNRPDRERSPDIAEGVTGMELDGAIRAQLRTLESRNGEWVAKHLVMAGRLIDEEPELAFQHALAASRRGGRLAAVREAVGLTAYAAGRYDEALRELRTFRRISGSHVHLPLMADSERGLGRPDRALELAHSPEAGELDAAGRVELAIVAAGARGDQGQWSAAAAELRIPQLDKNRAFSFSPRLFHAYADVLGRLGREEEAASWRQQAVLAEQVLGAGEEPEIIDLLSDEDDPEDSPEAGQGDGLEPQREQR